TGPQTGKPRRSRQTSAPSRTPPVAREAARDALMLTGGEVAAKGGRDGSMPAVAATHRRGERQRSFSLARRRFRQGSADIVFLVPFGGECATWTTRGSSGSVSRRC